MQLRNIGILKHSEMGVYCETIEQADAITGYIEPENKYSIFIHNTLSGLPTYISSNFSMNIWSRMSPSRTSSNINIPFNYLELQLSPNVRKADVVVECTTQEQANTISYLMYPDCSKLICNYKQLDEHSFTTPIYVYSNECNSGSRFNYHKQVLLGKTILTFEEATMTYSFQNIKIDTQTESINKQVQQHLIDNGCKGWLQKGNTLKHTEFRYLYVNKDGYFTHGDNSKSFDKRSNRQVSAESLIGPITAIDHTIGYKCKIPTQKLWDKLIIASENSTLHSISFTREWDESKMLFYYPDEPLGYNSDSNNYFNDHSSKLVTAEQLLAMYLANTEVLTTKSSYKFLVTSKQVTTINRLLKQSTYYQENTFIPGSTGSIFLSTDGTSDCTVLNSSYNNDARIKVTFEQIVQLLHTTITPISHIDNINRKCVIDNIHDFDAINEAITKSPIFTLDNVPSYPDKGINYYIYNAVMDISHTNDVGDDYYNDHDNIDTNFNDILTMIEATYINKSTNTHTTIDNPILAPSKPMWNHTKLKPNTQPVVTGDYVINSFAENPIEVATLSGVVESNYPLHKLHSTQQIRLNDWIVSSNGVWHEIRIKADKILAKDPANTAYRITTESEQPILAIDQHTYLCGAVRHFHKQQPITDIPAGAIVTKSTIQVSLAHTNIADHFDISLSNLKHRDHEVLTELTEALDHELNQQSAEWVYLFGPSGSGKSTVAIEYANRRGEYVLQQGTAQLTADDLIGYNSITTGEYFPSLLRKAVEHGYTFILDEIDACNPNTLLILNGLKHKSFQFPDALVPVHSNFRLIATANTDGSEYSETYSSRQPLDQATLDRFYKINYDMLDYHLALRYGLDFIKQLDLTNKSPRVIEREVRQLQIKDISEY